MPTARASIHVDATPEEVFDFVSDPWRIPEYVSLVLEILDVSDGQLGVGTKITEKAKPGPVAVTTHWEIIEFERPHRHVWRGHQVDMEMTLTKQISAEGSGARYEQWMEYRCLPRLRPLGWLLEKLVVNRAVQRGFDQVVTGIKKTVEAERHSSHR
jgi:hypothetical protein